VTDTGLVADALDTVGRSRAPRDLPEFAATGGVLEAWDVVADEPGCVPPELAARLPEMLEHQRVARESTGGDRLVHWDVRADNVLVRDGRVVLLDWAWACRGAEWLDTLTLALELRIQGGPDSDKLLAARPLTRDVPPEQLSALVACMAGFWAERAGRPAPPGLPTIRAWQEHCATASLAWLDSSRLWT
jgi:aminoglycoside phosphotransferase (APT) family kinase protein